jgi:hypothetical protein
LNSFRPEFEKRLLPQGAASICNAEAENCNSCCISTFSQIFEPRRDWDSSSDEVKRVENGDPAGTPPGLMGPIGTIAADLEPAPNRPTKPFGAKLMTFWPLTNLQYFRHFEWIEYRCEMKG